MDRFLGHENNGMDNVLINVYGTGLPIQEPHPFYSRWFNHKLKHAALRYEIGISTAGGDIVRVPGLYTALSYPDVEIFCDDLKDRLRVGERVITETGYVDAKAVKK